MNLYFIALIPDKEVSEEIRLLKEEMKISFNSSHALKSPAHITLQMPFKRKSSDEAQIVFALRQLAEKQSTFTVELNGFGHFAQKVIFIMVENHEPIVSLHLNLCNTLIDNLNFTSNETSPQIHPHITLATRDLTPQAFQAAWSSFQNKLFCKAFKATSFYLLKHNGRNWDIVEEFPFGNMLTKI